MLKISEFCSFFGSIEETINCFRYLLTFSDLKIFADSRPSASNFKSFSRSLEQFFLTVGQNSFGNKIPFLPVTKVKYDTKIFSVGYFFFRYKDPA